VTDLLCAPWMAVQAKEGDTPESIHAARLAVCEQFAEHYIARWAEQSAIGRS